MEMVHPGPLGVGIMVFYAEKGEVKLVNVSGYEGDPAGDGYLEITLPATMMKAITQAYCAAFQTSLESFGLANKP